MRKTFLDDDFQEWEAYVSAGAPHGSAAARIVFVCLSTPGERPRFVRHPSGDAVEAERELFHMKDEDLAALFDSSDTLP